MIEQNDFFLPGNRTGILLIHGLTGTPTEVRGVGRSLNRAGFTVYGMQLAGHCGDVQDLLATNRHDWFDSVVAAADMLRSKVDTLFVGGLSMGAVLALKYAARYPQNVQGVLVYGATFRYDGWTISPLSQFLAPWVLPICGWLRIGRNRMFNEMPPYGIYNEQLRERIVSSMLSGDSSAAGLPGNPWPSLSEMLHLSRRVRRLLPQVTAPCLILHAENDDIAHRRNGQLVKQSVSGPAQMVLLKNSYHMITIDNDRKEVVDRSIAFIRQHSVAHQEQPDMAVLQDESCYVEA
ncbi:MAG: alpha/beta hydrolase [Enterobacteriaceae bacterium]